MKIDAVILLFALSAAFSDCTKERPVAPAVVDHRTALTGKYACTYTSSTHMGTVTTNASGTETLEVGLGPTTDNLEISHMVDRIVTVNPETKEFGNTRGNGHFSQDSVYIYTFTTPGATSYTTFSGSKIK
jgi:hypothetical protein